MNSKPSADFFTSSKCAIVNTMKTLPLVVLLVVGASTARVDAPRKSTLGGGAVVLPARAQSMVGPSVVAGYNLSSNIGLDVSGSPLATLTRPVEVAWAFSLGWRERRHSRMFSSRPEMFCVSSKQRLDEPMSPLGAMSSPVGVAKMNSPLSAAVTVKPPSCNRRW